MLIFIYTWFIIEYTVHGSKNGLLYLLRVGSEPTHVTPVREQGP